MASKPQSARRGGNAGIRPYLTGSNLLCATLIRMSETDILTLIDAEIAELQQARALIAATGKKRPGRPKSVAIPTAKPKKKKRKLTPEGRARLVAAVKKRWAAQKKAAAKPAKKAPAKKATAKTEKPVEPGTTPQKSE